MLEEYDAPLSSIMCLVQCYIPITHKEGADLTVANLSVQRTAM